MEWRPLTGFENSYEVSSAGEVRRTSPNCLMHRRLTEQQMDRVRYLLAGGTSQRTIAAQVGVSQMVISRISRGVAYQPKQPATLAKALRRDGYYFVTLCVGGKTTHMAIHRAVAMTFIGPCEAGHQVNHKDGTRTNNAANNLEYVTGSENVRHAFDVLRRAPKLNPEKAAAIRGARGLKTAANLAKQYGISIHTVKSVWYRKSWDR